MTEYVVLRQVEMREEPIGQNPVAEVAWRPVTDLVDGETPDAGWALKVFRAPGKTAAIRQHTGDGPEILEGTWRAIPLSSWRGGITTRRVTAAERLPIDD